MMKTLCVLTLIGVYLVLTPATAVEDDNFSVETESEDVPYIARPSVKCHENHASMQSCQNFARSSIYTLNLLVRKHLNVSYSYQAMAVYFERDDVSYRGFAKFFQKQADETKEHSHYLMDYLKKRGGYTFFKPIPVPKHEWRSPLEALEDAIEMEKFLHEAVLDALWDVQPHQKNDPHLEHYFEDKHLEESVEFTNKLSNLITQVARLELMPIGMNIFDQELYEGKR